MRTAQLDRVQTNVTGQRQISIFEIFNSVMNLACLARTYLVVHLADARLCSSFYCRFHFSVQKLIRSGSSFYRLTSSLDLIPAIIQITPLYSFL